MKKEVKIIFHIDLNAFYASCAMIKEPYLKDKIFVVGGSGAMKRGVISTASYAARKKGIRSAMSVREAMDLYPKVVVVPTDFKLYRKYSNLFFETLKKYSSLVLMGSIDEAYVDMTETAKKVHPVKLAELIQKELLDKHQLPCSIGIAPTLFLAKMASDLMKPMGITVLRKKDIVTKLFPLPIKDMYGVGKKTYPRLEQIGVKTIGDLVRKNLEENILTVMSKQNHQALIDHIMGRSSDVVDPKLHAIPKSISNETTLNYDIDEDSILLSILTGLLKETHQRLIKEELVAKTIGIRLKDSNFKTITRSITIPYYTDNYDEIYEIVEQLFYENYNQEPTRLIGVSLAQIMLKKDLKEDYNLFTYQELTKREEKMYQKK